MLVQQSQEWSFLIILNIDAYQTGNLPFNLEKCGLFVRIFAQMEILDGGKAQMMDGRS